MSEGHKQLVYKRRVSRGANIGPVNLDTYNVRVSPSTKNYPFLTLSILLMIYVICR